MANKLYSDAMNTQEIPYGGSQDIPRRYPAQGIPTADQETLQPPMIDPVWTAVGGLMGGGAGIFKDLVMQALTGVLPNVVAKYQTGGGAPIMEQNAPFNVPDWYKMPAKQQYGTKETSDLEGVKSKSYAAAGKKPWGTRHYSEGESRMFSKEGDFYPRNYREAIPPIYPVGENPPKPEELIYHGLGTDLQDEPAIQTKAAIRKVGSMMESGMDRGWFAETPHKPFGPLYIGVHKNDAPDFNPRPNALKIDPSTELEPGRFDKISPDKLWLIDHEGNLLGKLGDPNKPYTRAMKEYESTAEKDYLKHVDSGPPTNFTKPYTASGTIKQGFKQPTLPKTTLASKIKSTPYSDALKKNVYHSPGSDLHQSPLTEEGFYKKLVEAYGEPVNAENVEYTKNAAKSLFESSLKFMKAMAESE